ncbi:MAG: beta-ketoacyl synthase N-terminal-like domain-containing protein [Pirellulaceae bacterium]
MLSNDIIVLSGPDRSSSSVNVAIAACRAGALGAVDLGTSRQPASDRLHRIARFAQSPFAVRMLLRDSIDAIEQLQPYHDQLNALILAGDLSESMVQSVRKRISGQVRLLIEVTSTEKLAQAEGLQIDGVILKGNEAAGWVAAETTFLLLQRWARMDQSVRSRLPAYAQGGVGPHTAAACQAAGVRGVVLDSQVLLTKGNALRSSTRHWIASYDGSQTHLLGESLGACFRFAAPPSAGIVKRLRALELSLQQRQESDATFDVSSAWFDGVEQAVDENDDPRVLIMGQDLAFATKLADRYVDVRGVVQGVIDEANANILSADTAKVLESDSPLAVSHGTGLPIVQGPMTRVSDTAEFAEAVAREGGLPLLALALMRGAEASEILRQTRAKLGDRGWGAGLLGFLPPEIRNEQVAAIKEHRPPMALIAGGRPDQAKELEAIDIPTYLHAPSPGLLDMFLREGARRFVLEGRECGGHVGPRSSFVLWESLLDVLDTFLQHNRQETGKLHLLLAGGIHDGISATMATSVTGRLAQLGVKVGVLMGSAYLFTKEAVDAGAIVPRFQQEAIRSGDTVLLETGPGHAIRCIRTPYRDMFDRERRRLAAEGKTADEITRELEWMNIGRLRVASKGLERGTPPGEGKSRLRHVPDDEQFERGMYMIGQVAALRDRVTTITELHSEVSDGGSRRLHEAAEVLKTRTKTSFTDAVDAPPPCDIAIVGMSAMYPGANTLRQYWRNILDKHYAVTEIPSHSHWDWKLFYDPDPRAPDKIISKWGGFLSDQTFNPFEYGITPRSLESIEPLQLLLLESMKRTLADACYDRRPFNRESACAVLGIGGGGSPMGVMYGIRSSLPILGTAPELPMKSEAIFDAVKSYLPEWTEDSFPGFLMNVAVGRVANRFNLGGSNYALDAACASSLAAVHACIRELQMGTTDVAFAMGADTVQTPYAFMAFSKTHALSPRGRCRPFDAEADGIVLSEGLGIVMLKRLSDAQRDGDKIYGVIRGIGSSSDGKDKGLTAPNAAGQIRALRRAYEQARIEPSTLGLVEAHGTGTVVGDRTEATSVATILDESGARRQSVAIGSVKSMIGHSKCAAGVAGLIKAAMALHTKTLPATLVESPSPAIDFPNTGLYLNTQTRPWIHAGKHPRRAGVSAFGFGGTNVHLVIEEYTEDFLSTPTVARTHWPAELFAWRAASPEALKAELHRIRQWLEAGALPELPELAASLADAFEKSNDTDCVAALVAKDLAELMAHLATAIEKLDTGKLPVADPRGVYLARIDRQSVGKTAVLFPGQGSQYPDMLGDLLLAFPQAREVVDHAAACYDERFAGRFAQLIFPPSAFTEEEREVHRMTLAETSVAQPALAACQWAAWRVVDSLGMDVDAFAGHSFGEFVALSAANAIDYDTLLRLSAARGDAMRDAAKRNTDNDFAGAMAAVFADTAVVHKELQAASLQTNLTIANDNSPQQVVISGPTPAIEQAVIRLTDAGLRVVKLDVSCAFHSPQVAAAADGFAKTLDSIAWQHGTRSVYSNTTASAHDAQPSERLKTLKSHLTSSVRFREQIGAMYADGIRTFIEVGPGSTLSGLVKQTLGEKPHVAVSIDRRGRDSLTQLVHAVAGLITAGVKLHPSALFEPRDVARIDLRKLDARHGHADVPKNAWTVNGMRSRPIDKPERHLLGQRRPESAKSPSTRNQGKEPDVSLQPGSSRADSPKPHRSSQSTSSQVASAKPASAESASQSSVPTQPALSSSQNTMQLSKPSSNRLPTTADGSIPHPAESYQDEATAVMLGYQKMMQQFLQTQRDVMITYLQGEAPDAGRTIESANDNRHLQQVAKPGIASAREVHALDHTSESVRDHSVSPPAGRNGSHPDSKMSEATGSSASNGDASGHRNSQALSSSTDSSSATPVKSEPLQDEASSKVREPKTQDAEPATLQQAEESLLELVADRTGYPVDMLDMDADLEGDLGIDSIKRVEILGGLAEALQLGGDGDDLQDTLELEKLTTIRTLRGIVEYLAESIFSDEAKKKLTS